MMVRVRQDCHGLTAVGVSEGYYILSTLVNVKNSPYEKQTEKRHRSDTDV